MRRRLGKRISSKIRQANEDMQELQRLMTKRSVYARQRLMEEARRPKHPKRLLYDL